MMNCVLCACLVDKNFIYIYIMIIAVTDTGNAKRCVMIESNHRHSPCSAIFTNSCFTEFEEKARTKSARTKERFAQDSPFSFFFPFFPAVTFIDRVKE